MRSEWRVAKLEKAKAEAEVTVFELLSRSAYMKSEGAGDRETGREQGTADRQADGCSRRSPGVCGRADSNLSFH